MKRQPNDDRPVIMSIHCSKKEYDRICELKKKTTCRSLSEYARKTMLGKPVAVTYRNLSMDALIDTINAIRNDLETLPEHRSLSERDKNALARQIGELTRVFIQIADLCIAK
jgi:hypothetical protein